MALLASQDVSSITYSDDMDDIVAGGVLEAASVASALDRYTEHDIEQLEKIVENMDLIVRENGLISDQVPLDTDFHDVLLSRIDNDLIVELCKRSCQGISKYLLYRHWVKIYTPREVVERHKVIIKALKTKDPKTVERVLREHYISSGERMAKYGVNFPKYS